VAEVQPQDMTEAEWKALGERLFGPDIKGWRFRCPTCNNVWSYAKADTFAEEQKAKLRANWHVEQECVGRYIDGAGCDWCAYGLFSGPFFVVRDGGRKTPVFGFDVEVSDAC
jgi:hypothetical protein